MKKATFPDKILDLSMIILGSLDTKEVILIGFHGSLSTNHMSEPLDETCIEGQANLPEPLVYIKDEQSSG